MNPRSLAWMDRLIWTLIYGGLLLAVLGIATRDEHAIAGWSMGLVGGVTAALGFVLIWVRSRMHDDAEASAQSGSNRQGTP